MTKGWTVDSNGWVIGNIFGFAVERNEVKRPGGEAYLVLDEDSKLGNLHTSEGSTIDGLIATLKAKGFAGQWCVGQGRIVQTRPVWAQGSLLLGGSATNRPMRMEVEQVAFTQSTLWTPAIGTFGPMTALAAFYAVEFGVPLKVPIASWKDNGSDISPAYFGSNNRRTAAAAAGLGNLTGWIHHCEVPQNLHADCGAYNRTGLFAAAQLLVDTLTPKPPPGGDDWMAGFTEAELDRLHKLAAGDQLVGFRAGMIQGEKKEPLKAPDTGKFAEAGRKLLNPAPAGDAMSTINVGALVATAVKAFITGFLTVAGAAGISGSISLDLLQTAAIAGGFALLTAVAETLTPSSYIRPVASPLTTKLAGGKKPA